MDLRLTPQESRQYMNALMSAFPMPGSLEQVVFFALGTHLNTLTSGGPYIQVAFELVQFVNANGKVWELLQEAIDENPGNPELRAFYDQIQARLQPAGGQIHERSQPAGTSNGQTVQVTFHFPPGLRRQLADLLVSVSTFVDYNVRTLLLSGIRGSTNLNRSPSVIRADIELIIDQLAERGRLDTGEWPLLLMLDNALPYFSGYESEATLRQIKQTLEQEYQRLQGSGGN